MKLKRILALALALVLVMSLFPAQALATEPTEDPTTPATTEAQVTETTVPTEASLPETTEEPQPSEGGSLLGDLLNTLTGGDEKQPGETTGETTSETTSAPETSEPTAPAETTVPVETTVPTETTGETQPTEQTKSYFQNLMEQPTWRALFDAIMADPEAAMALNEKEVLALEDFLKLLPDPGENADEQEAKEEVESTIQLLKEELGLCDCTCGTETEEHAPECPKFVPVEDADTLEIVSYGVYVGGVYLANGSSVSDGKGGTATLNGNVLTLNNFNYSVPAAKRPDDGYAYGQGYNYGVIYYHAEKKTDTLVIHSIGTNSIKATGFTRNTQLESTIVEPQRMQYCVSAIDTDASISFTGNGSLTLEGYSFPSWTDRNGHPMYTHSNGIYLYGDFHIKDVALTCVGGNAYRRSRGIDAIGSGVIEGNAVVNMTAGDLSLTKEQDLNVEYDSWYWSNSIGIVVNSGIEEYALRISDNARVTATGGRSTSQQEDRGYAGSFGLDVIGGILIEDNATVTATGGPSATDSVGIITTSSSQSGNFGIPQPLTITGSATVYTQAHEKIDGQSGVSGAMWGTVTNATDNGSAVFVGPNSKDVDFVLEADQKNADNFLNNLYASIERDLYPIWIENIRITRRNAKDILGTHDGDAATVYYDTQNNILYLDGYTTKTGNVHVGTSGTGENMQNISAGLYADCDLQIKLIGTNTVGNSETEKRRFNCGVYVSGDATFIGDGTLTATGGSSSLYSIGIYNGVHGETDSVLTFQDSVTVTANAGKSENHNSGIRANGTVAIKGNASVTANGAESVNRESNGIYAIYEISIADAANVTATGRKARGMSNGIFCEGIVTGGSMTSGYTYKDGDIILGTSGTVTAASGTTSGGAYQKEEGQSASRAIFARGRLTISDGTVKAASGDTSHVTVPGPAGSHAIEAQNEGIFVSGDAVIDAQGGNASGHSVGMYSGAGDILIADSAQVTAKGHETASLWNNGISTGGGDLTITTSGTVYAEGGKTTSTTGSGVGSGGINVGGNGRLTISNAGNVTAIAGESTNTSRGIYAGYLEVTSGNVEARSTQGKGSDGMNIKETITINNSTVSSTAGTATGRSAGIVANHAISITNSTIDATGNKSTGGDSYGIWSTAGDVTIDGGTVEATGGDTPQITYGIYAADQVTISDAQVEATGGDALLKTYGIYAADKVTITNAEVEAIGGTSTYDGVYSSDVNQRMYQSGGIVGINEISITNGDVTATGGTNKTGPTWGLLGTTIKIDGGEVTATGGHSPRFYSAGIAARNDGIDHTPTLGSLSITNGATVTASNVGKAGNQSQPIYAWVDITIDGSEVTAAAAPSGSHNTGILASTGDITMTNSIVTATANTADNNYSMGVYAGDEMTITGCTVNATGAAAAGTNASSYGLHAVKNVDINTSLVTALSDVATALHAGIYGVKLDSDSSVIFTDSIAKSTDETWENSLLYLDSQRNDTSYYGELRDDNGGTVNVVLAHSLDSNDVLIVKAGETLTTNGEISNGGKIYVNYTGMMTDTTGGKDYYEIVNGITKSSDPSVLADLTYASSEADGYQKFNPSDNYVEGYENAERHYAQDNVTVTVTCADPGELVFNIHVWQDGKDTDTGVTQSGTDSNIKTFTMPPYNTSYKAQPVKLIGQLLENFDLTIIKAFAEGTTPYADDLFLFTVKGAEEENETYSISVSIQGEGQVTIHDVPYGSYTIQEDSWSWRYTPDNKSYTLERKDINVADGNSFKFVNEMEKEQWLDYNDIERNIFK